MMDAQTHIQSKLKPPGSLGLLEKWAVRLCELQQTLQPVVRNESLAIFCADHGAARKKEEGGDEVSAYSSKITQTIVLALAQGGAAGTTFATAVGIPKERQVVVDVGVAWSGEIENRYGMEQVEVRKGKERDTRNFGIEAAMTEEECKRAEEAGSQVVQRLHDEFRCNAVALGEVGLGNTTASSALLAAFTGKNVEECCGRGCGLDEAGISRKVTFVNKAMELHKEVIQSADAKKILCAMGGFELAGIVGAIHRAHKLRMAVLVDGFICSVAALTAVRIWPQCAQCLFLCTRSTERGYEICRQALAQAMGDEKEGVALDMNLGLGEGTGAVLCFGALKAAAALSHSMISFKQATTLA